MLLVLPAFLRPRSWAWRRWRSTTRHATPPAARSSGSRTPDVPGDPGAVAFGADSLPPGGDVMRRVGAGSISRGSLRRAEARARTRVPAGSAEAPGGSFAAVGMARAGEGHGVLLLRHAAPVFPMTCLRLVQIVAGQTVTVLAGQGGSGSRAAVAALAAAIDARDNYTLSHSKDVVELAGGVAKRLGLSERRDRAGARRGDAPRRGQGGHPERDPQQARPARRGRVEDHARAPRDRRADPAAHARAGRDRAAGAPRARALGRRAATPTAWPARRSRSAAGSSSPATRTTR